MHQIKGFLFVAGCGLRKELTVGTGRIGEALSDEACCEKLFTADIPTGETPETADIDDES